MIPFDLSIWSLCQHGSILYPNTSSLCSLLGLISVDLKVDNLKKPPTDHLQKNSNNGNPRYQLLNQASYAQKARSEPTFQIHYWMVPNM